MKNINDEKDFEIEVLAEGGEISGVDIVTINEKSFNFERIKT